MINVNIHFIDPDDRPLYLIFKILCAKYNKIIFGTSQTAKKGSPRSVSIRRLPALRAVALTTAPLGSRRIYDSRTRSFCENGRKFTR